LKRSSLLSFWAADIIKVQYYPSDQTTAPSETQIDQHEERLVASFTLQ